MKIATWRLVPKGTQRFASSFPWARFASLVTLAATSTSSVQVIAKSLNRSHHCKQPFPLWASPSKLLRMKFSDSEALLLRHWGPWILEEILLLPMLRRMKPLLWFPVSTPTSIPSLAFWNLYPALCILVVQCVRLQQLLRNLDHHGSATSSLTPPVRDLALVPSLMSTSAVSEAMAIGKFLTLSLVHLRSLSFDYNVMFWQFDVYVFSGSVSLPWLENPVGLFQGINDWLIDWLEIILH